ncbi:MAG TPA: VWA domain-containing protein [Planctomycetes bacterium]|nr:VWA domain-containing protein [Planctomycetota bacterium]
MWAPALLIALGLMLPVFADSKEIRKLKKEFARAAAEQNEDQQISIIREIAGFGSEDALETVYELGRDHAKTPALYAATLDELASLDGILEYLQARYGKIKSKGDFRERVYIADVAAKVGNPASVTMLASFLVDKSPFVQGAAVESLQKTMSAEAIDPLIDLLKKLVKKRKDVLYHQVRDALWALTGRDFDLIEDWEQWWEPRKGTFDPKESDHEGKTGVKRKRRGNDPEFWGVPVESKNIVFVIDTSGSMKYVHKDDIPGLSRADGSDTGVGKGGGQMTSAQKRLARFWTRMEMAKRELRKVVKKMGKDAFFNCVRFDTTVSKFQKRAVPSVRGNKNKAQKWIDGLKHNGNTNTLDSLIQAFNADAKTNTIFFLSDGLPSKDGKVSDPTGPILDKVFELNRFRKIKIHTFGFHPFTQGGQPMPDLQQANSWLMKLAEATGGTYTDMKVDNNLKPDPDGP